MVRAILAFVALSVLLNSGCPSDSGKAPTAPSQVIGEVELYTFTPHGQDLLSNAQPLILPPDTLLIDVLEALGRDLAGNYFLKTYTDKQTDIHFEVLRVDEIPTPSRPLRIAVVNMVDTHRDAMKYFFQGSAGGQTTFYMLAGTLMQPHLSPPLLDGLVLLYNDKILPELDHINLMGILTPRSVQHVAKRAIQGARRKAVISDHDWRELHKLEL
jgi:hypothetical protein